MLVYKSEYVYKVGDILCWPRAKNAKSRCEFSNAKNTFQSYLYIYQNKYIMSIRSFSYSTGLSGFSNTNNIAYSNSLDYSQATTTAIVAAQSILLTGCSEEIALNAAREAVKSILSPSGNFFERRREAFLHRRKIKQQADANAK